jgi:type II secretory pathway component PulM
MKGYWNNLRPFEKRVVVGVASMLFIVFNVWFVLPHFSDWGRMKVRMGVARDKLGKYQTEIAQISYYSNEVRRLEGEGLSVPPEEQSVQFQMAIQTQAAQSLVNIVSSAKQTTRTNQFFLELSQVISVQSGESQLVDFLYNLGAGSSLVRVRDLTIGPDAPRQQLRANVKLVASYQKKAAPKGAPAAVSSVTKGKTTNVNVVVPGKNVKQPETRPVQTNKTAVPTRPQIPSSKRP